MKIIPALFMTTLLLQAPGRPRPAAIHFSPVTGFLNAILRVHRPRTAAPLPATIRAIQASA